MKSKSLVSIDQCSKEDILRILDNARKFEANPNRKVLEGKVAATLFFEPSTRTRLSFETAVNRLGGRVIGFSDASTTSSSKGETLKDTILMVSNYVDLIIMRHHLEGAARYASEVTDVPIINAGDGANQHPSQTMLDLYSIQKTQGKLTDLNIHNGRRPEIRTYRTLTDSRYVSFQPDIQLYRTKRTPHAGRTEKLLRQTWHQNTTNIPNLRKTSSTRRIFCT